MLWPLSLDDNNWRNMVHTLGIYNRALSFVMGRWQLTEYVHNLGFHNYALPVFMR